MIAIGISLAYCLSRAIVHLYHALLNTWRSCVDTCRSYKVSAYLYWHELSLFRKITWVGYVVLMIVASLMFSGLM
jgi:hypothetical protein